jgi:hypothetical protein
MIASVSVSRTATESVSKTAIARATVTSHDEVNVSRTGHGGARAIWRTAGSATATATAIVSSQNKTESGPHHASPGDCSCGL